MTEPDPQQQSLPQRVAELERQLAQLRGELSTASTTASMAAHGLDALEDELTRIADRPPATVAGTSGTADGSGTGTGAGGGASQRGQPIRVDELRTWVETVLLPTREPLVKTGRAQPTGVRWCPQWDAHPEAVARLRAMAEAHRAMQAEIAENGPGWIEATYWRDVADPLWRELTSDAGPFHACSPDSHAGSAPLAEQGP